MARIQWKSITYGCGLGLHFSQPLNGSRDTGESNTAAIRAIKKANINPTVRRPHLGVKPR
ncbi:MAG TPA: hypothetical protein DCR55_07480 [Lentisphaeria bacterium]|nr:hypothetical protein [Lentisphaeria bacterium]